MITVHRDGRYYWADVVDLIAGRRVGCTFKHTDRQMAVDEANAIWQRYTGVGDGTKNLDLSQP